MEFLDIPLYDNDLLKLLVRFSINVIVLFILVRVVYYPAAKRKDYLFSYILINIIIFFVCFTLKKLDLELGLVLGLFAIFGILRYRTDTVPIKEMTYLFAVIGISVVNSLANKKTSHVELLFTNSAILIAAFFLERSKLLKHEKMHLIMYDKVALITPERRGELITDLKEKTGLPIHRISIDRIDYLRDVAYINVFYYES